MTDRLTPAQRHLVMSHIRSRNTKPEIKVRQWLWRHGYRYRLNVKSVPGKPDIVMRNYRTAIFVNGCFWHGHKGCDKYRLPKTNVDFWKNKIYRNRKRDQENYRVLQENGWQVIVVWECQLTPKHIEQTMNEVELQLNERFLSLHRKHIPVQYNIEEEQSLPMAAETLNYEPMPPRLIIFDLDGTLLDTLDDLSAAVNHAMEQRGFPQHTRDEYMKMVGHGARNLMSQALPAEHKDDEAMIDAVLADFRTYYNAHIDVYTKPFPGITQLIECLHQKGIKLAVASNKFQEGTEHLIKEFFSDIPFVAVLGNRPNNPLKPDPEVVGEVLRKAGISKENAVMVGDSDTDMETASNGGIRGIAVNWGYRNMRNWTNQQTVFPPAQEPTVVDTVEELLKCLFL